MESWVNFSGKEGHPNIQHSTRLGIEPRTSGLGGRDLYHCTNPSAYKSLIISPRISWPIMMQHYCLHLNLPGYDMNLSNLPQWCLKFGNCIQILILSSGKLEWIVMQDKNLHILSNVFTSEISDHLAFLGDEWTHVPLSSSRYALCIDASQRHQNSVLKLKNYRWRLQWKKLSHHILS